MKLFYLSVRSWFLTSAMLLIVSLFATSVSAQASIIEGTYKLVSRTLPDGTVLYPPDVIGLLTVMDGYRTVNIFWKDADGKPVVLSHGTSYTMTATDFTETNLFLHAENFNGEAMINDFSNQTGTSPMKVKGERVEFKWPLDDPLIVIEGNKKTATIEGALVDLWERVVP
jgi:hypothetical protein